MAASNVVADTNLIADSLGNTKDPSAVSTESQLISSCTVEENTTEELLTIDRFQQRLQRFGTITPESKKLSRALRFGTSHEIIDDATKKRRIEKFGILPDSVENDQEKKRQRAERFHLNDSTLTMDEETKQKRIDRFGVVTSSTNMSMKNKADKLNLSIIPTLSDTIKKRTQRFGDISQVAKINVLNEQKAKRLERFRPNTSI